MNVANHEIIRRLTLRSLKTGKLRNIVAVIAIALTTVLFTTIFTLGGNMITSIQNATMRQVGTSAHAGAKSVTQDQYDHLFNAPSIRDISYNIAVGVAENELLRKNQTEIRYSEDKAAKWMFSYPEAGAMPRGESEAACSTITLDLLGIPHEIGASVPLEFSVNGRKYMKTFTLCGYWTGDPVMAAQQLWVSRAYADSVAPAPTVPFLQTDGRNFAGYLNADIWFSNSVDIEGSVGKLLMESGIAPDEIGIGINWAYLGGEIDPAVAVIAVFVLLLILLSGYLIIYSIFTISVTADIHFFGLLKTIGTTKKQLHRIVRRQALLLSIAGIPPGLILGWLSGYILTPALMRMTVMEGNFTPSANPLIFIFSAVFSSLTVFISCNRPSKKAAKVSPVESVRFIDVNTSKRKVKRSGRITPASMAWANIRRNPKRLAVIVLSLSISLILLNSVFSAVKGFDMNKYLSRQIAANFVVADATVLSPMSVSRNYNGITADFQDDLSAQDGVTNIGYVYFNENEHSLSDFAFENALRAYDAVPDENYSFFEEAMDIVREEHKVPLHIYGMNEFLTSRIAASDRTIDFDKLSRGDYVLSTYYYSDSNGYFSYYEPGDRITLDIGNGISKEYTVLDYAEMPYSFTAQHGHLTDISIIMAESQFAELYGDTQPMMAVYDCDKEYVAALEGWTENYCANVNSDLDYVSRATYEREFKNMLTTYMVIGGALSFILALIGILNFTNSQVTSIFARRRELAILQGIGLAGKQARAMMFFEGAFHAVLTMFFTVTVGAGAGYWIMQVIAGQLWFFSNSFTLSPSLYCVLPLLAICAAVPLVCYRRLAGESIVERLRVI